MTGKKTGPQKQHEKNSCEKGVCYGISGLPWLKEVLVSAASMKKEMPELPLELHIDQETHHQLDRKQQLLSFFDFVSVHEVPKHWRTLKFSALKSRRFEKVLFLDGDTYITGDITGLFDLLDHFDIAAMPAPQRIHSQAIESGLFDLFPSVPEVFPEYNTGVISFRQNEKTAGLIKHWEELFEKGLQQKGYPMDQAALRVSLYHSDL
jgi:hypothetical protein